MLIALASPVTARGSCVLVVGFPGFALSDDDNEGNNNNLRQNR